ncbi:MAG: helix-hairpin-helix domain-containing protein [Burkholderiaceae bacterium]
MLKKFLLMLAILLATTGLAFAQVEINQADQAALDGIKGIGPTISKQILDERKKNGSFKDWTDLQKRVRGIGDANSTKLSDAGLTVNGQPKPKTTANAETRKETAKAGMKEGAKK